MQPAEISTSRQLGDVVPGSELQAQSAGLQNGRGMKIVFQGALAGHKGPAALPAIDNRRPRFALGGDRRQLAIVEVLCGRFGYVTTRIRFRIGRLRSFLYAT